MIDSPVSSDASYYTLTLSSTCYFPSKWCLSPNDNAALTLWSFLLNLLISWFLHPSAVIPESIHQECCLLFSMSTLTIEYWIHIVILIHPPISTIDSTIPPSIWYSHIFFISPLNPSQSSSIYSGCLSEYLSYSPINSHYSHSAIIDCSIELGS